ncbi:MAG: PVC-type heme-binding CxxCH protein [Bacteroidota bacterium]
MRSKRTSLLLSLSALVLTSMLCFSCQSDPGDESVSSVFHIVQNDAEETLSIFRKGGTEPVLTQNAKAGMRPYLHPIMAPDGNGSLTQYSPGHHKHQTGLYWGFTRVNGSGAPVDTLKKWFYNRNKPQRIKDMIGRDFFHFNGESHWKKVSAEIVQAEGEEVKWNTVYHMLDAEGNPIMEESMHWSLMEKEGKFMISLEWNGKAIEDITINEFSYGGMFLRMPWHKDIKGEAVNNARQRNRQAEGKKAMWVDVGMEIEGRDDWGHITIFDHPDNATYPTTWRVDGQLGIGPCRAIEGDWHIKQGEIEVIKHRIVAYTGKLNDVEMNETWEDYVGDQAWYITEALWGLAQEEGKVAEFLTPQAAVDNMTVTDGYEVNVWASEPMITQPMAFCWDDKGRLWIAENRDYENRGEGFSNDGNSRILILEDTDRDGVADKKKVFAEGIPFPAAIAVGFDGLFLGSPPNLLFLPDKNQDDKAEMADIEVRLTGWGIRDRHETLNSFHWGPDGWLYGLEGFATPSKIRKPKGKGKLYGHKDPFPDVLAGEGIDINGGVWRYHPTKDRFEVVAHGFSNPWGLDYDSKGQMFITACVIPHMFHVIPGGIYHRQGGQHFNPYVYKDIRTIVDHSHRSAHGGARVYQSDAFPAEQYGRLFMANIHEHAVLSDELVPKGSGFVAKHGEDFVMANNAQWIGFSMEIGPGGDLYVLDWHDGDICGNSVMQKETGRVFRIRPTQSHADHWDGRFDDLTTFSDKQLAALQTSKSNWHARRARVILQYRATTGTIDADAVQHLNDILQSNQNQDHRLRALWALHVSGNLSQTDLIASLSDADPHIRAWSIQFLGEDFDTPKAALSQFEQMALSEPSPVVRMYLAAALQRLKEEDRWTLIEHLVGHAEDADDHNIPKMIWFGFEPLAGKDPQRALALASNGKMPMISQFTARRAVDGDALDAAIAAVAEKSSNQVAFLEGIREAVEGRSDITAPAEWKSIADKLADSDATVDLALSISQQFGDSEAANQYMVTLRDANTSTEDRNAAIKALASKQWPELENELPKLWEDPSVRVEAIRALAAYNNGDLGWQLMKQYETFSSAEKLEVVQAMASRPTYGSAVNWALKEGFLPKKDVPAYVARQLRRVVGNGFVETWGPIDDLGFDKEQEFAKYKALLSAEAVQQADIANGEAIFKRTCAACHKIYGEGGILGPDLTGSNRGNVDYLLSNMLDPSGDIQDDYKMVVITTRDGRTYSGNIASESARQLSLRVVGQEAVVLNKSDIQSRESTENSMMPEGLLQTLSEKEVTDLVGFLGTQRQE